MLLHPMNRSIRFDIVILASRPAVGHLWFPWRWVTRKGACRWCEKSMTCSARWCEYWNIFMCPMIWYGLISGSLVEVAVRLGFRGLRNRLGWTPEPTHPAAVMQSRWRWAMAMDPGTRRTSEAEKTRIFGLVRQLALEKPRPVQVVAWRILS
jgi:hypothetical protein